ncbi:MAG: hypothetical protein ACI8UZ_003382, partial [Akkermansiaceae bacterium]
MSELLAGQQILAALGSVSKREIAWNSEKKSATEKSRLRRGAGLLRKRRCRDSLIHQWFWRHPACFYCV